MLTVKEIAALAPGSRVSDKGPRGSGALWIKRTQGGTLVAYFRYSVNRQVRDMNLGPYDDKGQDGLTLAEARARVGELQRMIQGGIPDPKSHLMEQERLKAEAEASAQARAKAAAAAAKRAEEERSKYTLGALMETYASHLERQGKAKTAYDVRNTVKIHLTQAAPELAALPAREVSKTFIATRIREVRETGKERTAGKLRSFLFAAYALAQRAEGDSAAPSTLIPYAIEVNPVTAIKSIPVRPGERTLSREELRTLVSKLGASLADQALKLALYSGGQRVTQLLRAKVSDFDPASGILRLWDPKGRRLSPREHRLPLGPVAMALVKALVARARLEQPEALDPPLFASGAKVLVVSTLTHRLMELNTELVGPKFDYRDLRRTVETEMAGLGFSTDLRAQLLSHGLSGVQNKHYDRHTYLDEKTVALARWERHLEGKEPAKVASSNTRRRRTPANSS